MPSNHRPQPSVKKTGQDQEAQIGDADPAHTLLFNALRIARLGSAQWDLRTNTADWSDEFYRIVGRSRDDLEPTVENFIKILAPQEQHEATSLARKMRGGGDIARERDYHIVRPDGDIRILHNRADYVYGDDGSPTGVVATFQDVTEAHAAKEKLAESEQRFRDIAETSSDLIWELDTDCVVTYLSRPPRAGSIACDLVKVGESHLNCLAQAEAMGVTSTSRDIGFAFFSERKPFRDFRRTWTLADGSQQVWNRSGVPIFASDGTFRAFELPWKRSPNG